MRIIAVVGTENDTALAIVQMDGDEVRTNSWVFEPELSEHDRERLNVLIGFVQGDEPG